MKKRIAVFLLAVVLCLSITGCTLEGMRQTQVFYNKEGNVTWKGHEYVRLDADTVIWPLENYDVQLYVTQEDVPVLLQEMYGDRMYPSIDERFLVCWNGDIFCRSDCYEQYKDYSYESVTMDRYCFQYTSDYGNSAYYCLTEAEVDWLNALILNAETNPIDPDEFYSMDYEWITDMQICSEDLLVREFAFDIYRVNGSYCFMTYSEDNQFLTQVPRGEIKALEKMIEPALYY